MHSELITERDIYNKRFPSFNKPKIIGYLSLNSERQYMSNSSQLKFVNNLIDKKVHYDLNYNNDKTKHRLKDLDEKITHLLQFLLDQKHRLNISQQSSIENAQFFCYRGLLTCIANTPYENREAWKIVAVLFNGNIYLCALDTEEKILRNRNMSEREKMCTHWGYKFEQYIVSDMPGKEPNIEDGVDENEEFSLVFKTMLNNHTIFYGAEMDGILSQGITMERPSGDMGQETTIEYLMNKQFVELKTNAHLEFGNQENNFRRFKTRKWWMQSFLAGVDKILCGFRNQDGIVEELKVFQLNDLAKMSQRFWKPNICLNFLETFLTYVKRCLAKEIRHRYGEKSLQSIHKLPLIALQFEWSPRSPVRVTDVYDHDANPILPQWFINNIL